MNMRLRQSFANFVARNLLAVVTVTLALLTACATFAGDREDWVAKNMKGGPEWEFSSEALLEHGIFATSDHTENPDRFWAAFHFAQAEQKRFVGMLRERCPQTGCRIEEVGGKWKHLGNDFRVTYPDGFWFQVSFDPGCIEVLAKPGTAEDFERASERLDRDLFGLAEEAELVVWSDSKGHFNFGARSAFGDDVDLFFRFFADQQNNASLALGSLGLDPLCAPPLCVLPDKSGQAQRDALTEIFAEAKLGRFRSIDAAARAINQRVYTATYHHSDEVPQHNQAVNLEAVAKVDSRTTDERIELRYPFGQPDTQSFVKLIRLFKARIRYLAVQRAKGEPLVYNPRFADTFDYPARSLKSRFYLFVIESGLEWDEFESLLAPGNEQIRGAKLAAFLSEDATLAARLGSLNLYMDLLETSPYVRELTVKLLADPRAANLTERSHILRRLSALADSLPRTQVVPPAKTGFVRHLMRVVRPGSQNQNVERTNWAIEIMKRAGGPAAPLRVRCESALR